MNVENENRGYNLKDERRSLALTYCYVLQIAAEIAAPLSGCNKIVMVSNGQGDVGASKLTGEILDIVARLPKAVESLTGVDISKVC